MKRMSCQYAVFLLIVLTVTSNNIAPVSRQDKTESSTKQSKGDSFVFAESENNPNLIYTVINTTTEKVNTDFQLNIKINKTSTQSPCLEKDEVIFPEDNEYSIPVYTTVKPTIEVNITKKQSNTNISRSTTSKKLVGSSNELFFITYSAEDDSTKVVKPTTKPNNTAVARDRQLVTSLSDRSPIKPASRHTNPDVLTNLDTSSTLVHTNIKPKKDGVRENFILDTTNSSSLSNPHTIVDHVVFEGSQQNYNFSHTIESTTKVNEDKFFMDVPQLDCSDENSCRVDDSCRPCF